MCIDEGDFDDITEVERRETIFKRLSSALKERNAPKNSAWPELHSSKKYGRMPHGRGKLIYRGGQEYEGDFDRGKPHGRGIYRSAAYTYEGTFHRGKSTGEGKITWEAKDGEDPDVYEGAVIEALPHGWGVKKYGNGDHYEGPFVRGLRDTSGFESSGSSLSTAALMAAATAAAAVAGKEMGLKNTGGDARAPQPVHGRCRYASGDVYEGEWSNDQRSGAGSQAFGSGDQYDGNWLDDRQHGHGRMVYFPSGDAYEGDFEFGRRLGPLVEAKKTRKKKFHGAKHQENGVLGPKMTWRASLSEESQEEIRQAIALTEGGAKEGRRARKAAAFELLAPPTKEEVRSALFDAEEGFAFDNANWATASWAPQRPAEEPITWPPKDPLAGDRELSTFISRVVI